MVSSKIFAQLLFSSVALAGSLDLRQAGTKVSKSRRKNPTTYPYSPKKTTQKTNIFLSLFFFPQNNSATQTTRAKLPAEPPTSRRKA